MISSRAKARLTAPPPTTSQPWCRLVRSTSRQRAERGSRVPEAARSVLAATWRNQPSLRRRRASTTLLSAAART